MVGSTCPGDVSDFAPPQENEDLQPFGLVAPISPAELIRAFLTDRLNPDIIPGGVVVGPAEDAQIQAGCISIMDAGTPQTEMYARLVRVRTQVRCLAPQLDQIDRIARAVQDAVDQTGRVVITQPSTENSYLMHYLVMSAGPSMHRDSEENFEALIFTEEMFGLDPVSGPGISYT